MHGAEMHSPKPGEPVQVPGFASHTALSSRMFPHSLLFQVSRKEKAPPPPGAFPANPGGGQVAGRRTSTAHSQSLSPSLAPLLPWPNFPRQNNQPLSHRDKAEQLRSSKFGRAIPWSCSILLLLPSCSSLPPAPTRGTRRGSGHPEK